MNANGQFVVLALGSNLGDSKATVLKAMDHLEGFSTQKLRRSSLWRSEPVDCPPNSPAFVNAVVGLIAGPEETPESLLEKLQSLEKSFGRVDKKVHNEPRPLDLDIIVFGNQRRNGTWLVLPHPRAHQRAFVLLPLSEIAPELRLPGQAHTVAELVRLLPPRTDLVKLG